MKLSRITKNIPVLIALLFVSVVSVGFFSESSQAIDRELYDRNNILFYDPDAVATCSPTGSVSTSVSSTSGETPSVTLPAETTRQLDSQGIKELAEASRDAYAAGEEVGIPWTVMAAVHYREATMNPNRSIADGGALGRSQSMDGIPVGATLAEDVKLQAQHFKDMAKSVYDIELTLESSGDDWGYAFLAYNRGFMYKNWNKTFDESPYVMNGYDESHLNMRWNDADSYVRPGGQKLNSVSGKVNEQIGAMSVLAYLGGPSATSNIACAGGGGAVNGNIVETAKNFALETPQQNHSSSNFENEAKPEFVAALKQYNSEALGIGHVAYADCGIFVSTVMRASGADTEFPSAGTWNMMAYLKENSSGSGGKYTNLGTPNPETLQPGDLLIYSRGTNGHISIYSGPISATQTDPTTPREQQITMIDASQAKRVPSYRPNSQLMWMVGEPGVLAFRLNQQ